jgi:hypothetical protein
MSFEPFLKSCELPVFKVSEDRELRSTEEPPVAIVAADVAAAKTSDDALSMDDERRSLS